MMIMVRTLNFYQIAFLQQQFLSLEIFMIFPLRQANYQKEFTIQLNGGKWNFEHKYALAFFISDASGTKLSSEKDTVIAFFSVKNKYDGVYKFKLKTTGWAAYSISDGVTAEYPDEYLLITKGTNSLSGSATYRGDFLLPAIDATGAPTAFGATAPIYVFDTDTDKLIDVKNSIPDDGRGNSFHLILM